MSDAPEPVSDLDWGPERARSFAGAVTEVWIDFLGSIRSLPVAPPATRGQTADAVAIDIPEEPMPVGDLAAYLRGLLDHSVRCGHPAFVAYISGAGTVPGAAAELLAAGLNANVGGWLLSPAASEVELRLTRWLADLFGLPETAGGLIVPGGAIANLVALKCARDAHGSAVRAQGVGGDGPRVVYASEEAHVTVDRAADILGLGTNAIRHVPVDAGLRMQPAALEELIENDLAAGLRPVAVVATAGTTGTGAIDPLPAIADVCARHRLWFHVDAAYGGAVILTEDLRSLLTGIERADSITLDPHKWLYTPLASGCVLVRDLQRLADSFGVTASYVHEDLEQTDRGPNLGFFGPQFSRPFDALKVWVSLLAHGRAAYARRISHDAELAHYLARRVEERPEFELAAPVGLSICCFRYRPPDLAEGTEAYLDLLNKRLLTALQLDGTVFPSNAVVSGRFALRACIVNFRTEAPDLDRLLEIAAELGAKLDRELRAGELAAQA